MRGRAVDVVMRHDDDTGGIDPDASGATATPYGAHFLHAMSHQRGRVAMDGHVVHKWRFESRRGVDDHDHAGDGRRVVVMHMLMMGFKSLFLFLTALWCSVMTVLSSTATWIVDGGVSAMPAGGTSTGSAGEPITRSTFHSEVPKWRSRFNAYTRFPAPALALMGSQVAMRSVTIAWARAFECLFERGWYPWVLRCSKKAVGKAIWQSLLAEIGYGKHQARHRMLGLSDAGARLCPGG
jgi:hypothetical protein